MPSPRRHDSERELLALGIVRGNPLSAYAIDRAVRSHTALFRVFGRGNLYHFVACLAQAGYLASRSSKAARGPAASKLVYRLTAKGEQRFHELLRSVMLDPDANESALEIALVLLGELSRREATRLLEERKRELAAYERRLKRLFGDMTGRSGPAVLANSHAVHRVKNELRFLHDTLLLLNNSRWHSEWK